MRDQDFDRLEASGVHLFGAEAWLQPEWMNNFDLAMDAQPALSTTPNNAIPAWLTSIVDPSLIRILFAPNKAAKIFGEVQRGDWTMQTAYFPIVEYTGEVSSYGDYSNNGRTGLNTDFPNRQAYLYQIIKEYGQLELARAGLARIAWAAELDRAAIEILNKFQNLTYFYGVQGLENYGLFNDPSLSASLTPATKANGGVTWFTNTGSPNASANEVYNDIVAVYEQLVLQAGGHVEIDMETPIVLAMSPALQVALTFTNSFNVNVEDLLRKSFPRIRLETAVQYGKLTTSNPQGVAAGNFMQMIAETVGGQDTGYMAFNEKLKTHNIVIDLSSYKQKASQGTWGAIIRQPFAIASMIGM
jgi:hypothetical protein